MCRCGDRRVQRILVAAAVIGRHDTRSGPSAQAGFTSGPLFYVSDETGGNVIVIDPAAGQVVEKIP